MPEISDAELRMFARYQNIGTPEEISKKISDLEKDNATQREEIRGFKDAQPGADQVIVSKEDADLLPKYKDLGTPKDLKAKIDAGETAQKDLALRTRKDAALSFAKAAGLAEETVDTLISLPDLSSASFEVKAGKVKNASGKEVETTSPVLVITDDKGNQERLDFTKAQERFPALKGLKTVQPDTRTGTPRPQFVQQSPGDKGGSSESIFERIRREKAEEQEKAATRLKETKSVDERLGFVRPQ